MSESIHIDQRGGTLAITLNRAHVHNAFNDALVVALTGALDAAATDPSVRVVVLSGAGSTFSAGTDPAWLHAVAADDENANRADALRLARLLRTLNHLPKPTVARVNGAAYGNGIGLIACCDIALGCDGAKFALPDVKLGLVNAVIAPHVLAAIGTRHARRLWLSAEVFDSAEAVRIGLLHQSVPLGDLDAALERTLHWLGKGGPTAQAAAKQLLLRSTDRGADGGEALDAANAALTARLRVSPEGRRGIDAFIAKRAPAWGG